MGEGVERDTCDIMNTSVIPPTAPCVLILTGKSARFLHHTSRDIRTALWDFSDQEILTVQMYQQYSSKLA